MGPSFDPCAPEAPWGQAWRLAGPTAPLMGVGLHSGQNARVQLWPGEPGSGVLFQLYQGAAKACVPATLASVVDTRLATTLGAEGLQVATVEHLMAALWGLGLSDVVVELEGVEVPAVDGSALPWVELLREAKAEALPALRPRVALPLLRQGDEMAWVEGQAPSAEWPGASLSLAVDFPHPAVGAQSLDLSLEGGPHAFVHQLAGARTFGAKRDWASLMAMGKALGASACNCVPLEDEGPSVPWRWPDEVARHKALDALGDLALAGLWWEGRLALHHAGHGLHVAFARRMAAAATTA